jgi:hypothetical protein
MPIDVATVADEIHLEHQSRKRTACLPMQEPGTRVVGEKPEGGVSSTDCLFIARLDRDSKRARKRDALLITSRLGGLTKLGTVAFVPRITSKLCPCTVYIIKRIMTRKQ